MSAPAAIRAKKWETAYDTPTLLDVYRNGPYLHDGRARTLHDVLVKCNASDKHGTTSHLKPNEIDDLIAFLKSLPFEPPPTKTPNTVKDYAVLSYPRPKVGDGPILMK